MTFSPEGSPQGSPRGTRSPAESTETSAKVPTAGATAREAAARLEALGLGEAVGAPAKFKPAT